MQGSRSRTDNDRNTDATWNESAGGNEAYVTAPDDKPEPYSSIKLLIVGAAFILGMQYAPSGWIWGLLGLIAFPLLVSAIAGMVFARMSWTPSRVFRAKRLAGSAFVALCAWQAALSAHETEWPIGIGTFGNDRGHRFSLTILAS
jgi:hypothetical protein